MKNKLLIIILLYCLNSFGQKGKVIGKIVDQNGLPIPFTTVFIKNINKVVYSNDEGFFSTPKLNYGGYIIEFQSLGYNKFYDSLYINKEIFNIGEKILKEKNISLEEFEIVEKEEFNIRKLRAIEGVMITQGKKSEAINVSEMDANKATNLSRQIFAKIPGLNIWESDGAGIQIGLGGRGLNPSRNSNFNTRQNGYDISADALGYPESYYTPPSEAIQEIQLIRGAASLQFGPQFGGLINFKLKDGSNISREKELIARHTIGSFGLNNTFISLFGEQWNLGSNNSTRRYYAYLNYKFGNDFRPNSEFDVIHGHVNIQRKINDKSKIGFEFTKMYYLAHQPGGLTDDDMFRNPDTSRRERNWFQVDWNLANINYDYEFNSNTKLNSRTFGLIAKRNSLGFIKEIIRGDPGLQRNLIAGNFQNIGNETRLVHLYEPLKNPWAFVVGVRVYKGYNHTKQGNGNDGSGPDFYFSENSVNTDFSSIVETDYNFPSYNLSLFGEHIFNLNNKLSITPGLRYEYISTSAFGSYREIGTDLAGNVFKDTIINSADRINKRDFLIFGIGMNYKLTKSIEIYSNFSQNYRSINFTDMQINNPNFQIDSLLKDETGYNLDIGARGRIDDKLYFDASIYSLFYDNRIGTRLKTEPLLQKLIQYRTNISQSRTIGFEMMIESDWMKILPVSSESSFRTFVNFSYNKADYINSNITAFQNKKVELVPPIVVKTGFTFLKNDFSISYQYSYTDEHFSDATNAVQVSNSAIGIIPSYSTMDISAKYKYNKIQIEAGINNLTDEIYFTRRATGYPGPGIIPSPPRNFYIGLEIKL